MQQRLPSISVNGETKILGLIGEHISYSWSPAMHNAAAVSLGLNALYVPFSLPSSQVLPFLEAMWHTGALGFNVTQPHKALVANLLGGGAFRSVNTIYRGNDGWLVGSTDAAGFDLGLQRLGRPLISFERVVILGAGGAALAILDYLREMIQVHKGGPLKVIVLRRDQRVDQALREMTPQGGGIEVVDFTPAVLARALAGAGKETLLVQASSAPLYGDPLEAFVPALENFKGVVTDLVYGKPSALYFAAIALDLLAQDGEAMLIEQALLSQKLWWNREASYDLMLQALRGKA